MELNIDTCILVSTWPYCTEERIEYRVVFSFL